MARECNYEEPHARQVTRLALRLFDELKDLHQLNDEHRLWLQSAALLHDIGWVRGQKEHHKASRDLILQSEHIKLPLADKTIIALVARYHRRTMPADDHRFYADLNLQQKEIVRKLAALLRIADGLDRRHISSVKDLSCVIEPKKVIIKIDSDNFSDMERETAKEKADLFEAVFQKEIVIEWRKK